MSDRKNILLVEDEAMIAIIEKQMLQKREYNVIIASSGEKAIDIAQTAPDIDLILMDINMGKGKMDGTEAAEIILKERDVPILFLSSYTQPEIVEKTERITSYGYVVKDSGDIVLNASIKMAFKLHEAHRKLRESKETAERYLNVAAELIISLNSKGNIILLNDSGYKLLGYNRGELIGKNWFDTCLPEKSRVEVKEVFNKLVNGEVESVLTYENPVITKSGNELMILWHNTLFRDADGKIIGLLSSGEDITERKHAEEALKESEEKYRLLFDDANDVIFIHDEKARILSANLMAFERLGYSQAELMSMTVNQVDSPEESRHAPDRIARLMKQGRLTFETVHQRKDGSLVPTEASSRRIIWDGQPAIMSICRDITERKQAEDQVKSLLSEKELILREVHRRIKNNMATMKSLLSLQADSQKDPSVAAVLSDAGNRLQSMMVLYDKLYRSKDMTGMPANDYLAPLVNEIVGTFPAKMTVNTEVTVDDFILPVEILSPLGIIINELMTNTMKYAFPNKDDGLITLSAVKKGSHVILIIADNGMGIPDAIDPESPEGFGLHLVRLLTEQLDGTITTERDRGTRFILEFDI